MKSFKLLFRLILIGLLLNTSSASAYELATHGRLTEKAYHNSVLATDAQLLKDLGIKNTDDAFGKQYYDMGGSLIILGSVNKFEKEEMRTDIKEAEKVHLTIQGWLMRGAIREDDHLDIEACNYVAPNPKEDRYPEPPKRPLNHFYDPVGDRPLTVMIDSFSKTLGDKAPNWALGTIDAFTQPLQSEPQRRNHFTLFDTIEAMYRATTGYDQWNQTAGRDDAGYPAEATREDRQAYWATAFRSLGNILHLVQDMGQPQHTRNDAHSGLDKLICFEELTGHASAFERYIEARVTKKLADKKKANDLDSTLINFPDLIYNYSGNPYPIPKFSKYGDYWSTREGESGRGLADYSNREFFSAGTNIGDSKNEYTSPNVDTTLYNKSYIEAANYNGAVYTTSLLLGTVEDNQNVLYTKSNVALSTEGLFDSSMHAYNLRTFTLNKYNYDAMAELLIPRAVSYSTGLINHFFRGRLQIMQANRVGDVLTVRFKNVSARDSNNQGFVFTDGKFELFYEDINGIMQPLTVISSDLPSGSNTVALGETVNHQTSYTFTVAHPPEDNIALPPHTDASGNQLGTDTPFVLVYRGQIGQEIGIAAITFSRDGLTTYYAQDYSKDPTVPVTFTTQVAATPGKGWRAFSDGPPGAERLTHGPVTNLGNGELLVSGTTGAENPGQYYAKLFKSFDTGRTYLVTTNDLSPAHNGLPYSVFESKIYVGGTSLVTLRRESLDANNTLTYRFYQSDNLGQTWTARGAISNVVRRMTRLFYLGESGGQKKYVALAVIQEKQGPSLYNRWSLLRSNDSGQSFVVEPIAQFIDSLSPPYTDASEASAQLVHLGTDAEGNATLGLAIKLQLAVDTPYLRNVMKYYTSTDSGVTWSERSEIPPSPRIVAGTFPAQSQFYVEDLIYLGTPEGGQPQLYLSTSQLNQVSGLDGNIIEYFLSTDGGTNWTSVPGPNVTITTERDAYGSEWEVMTNIPSLYYPLDNGAIPGLYN